MRLRHLILLKGKIMVVFMQEDLRLMLLKKFLEVSYLHAIYKKIVLKPFRLEKKCYLL